MSGQKRKLLTTALGLGIVILVLAGVFLRNYRAKPVAIGTAESHAARTPAAAPGRSATSPSLTPAGTPRTKLAGEIATNLDDLIKKEIDDEAIYPEILASLPRRPADGAKLLIPRITRHGQVNVSFSADGKWIVFTATASMTEQIQDIYLYSVKDGTVRNLTNAPARACPRHPSISPDGTTVLYCDGQPAVWKLRVDGGSAQKLINGGLEPVWASDGRHFTYLQRDPARIEVLYAGVFDVTTGKSIKRFEGNMSQRVTDLTFLPKSNTLLYRRLRMEPGRKPQADIVIESLSTGQKDVITLPQGSISHPVLSPDERYIAYAAMDRPGMSTANEEIYVYDRKTKRNARVTCGHAQYPCWMSPTAIAFLSARDTGKPAIYYVDVRERLALLGSSAQDRPGDNP
jgi:Tol biopolymer transport system component